MDLGQKLLTTLLKSGQITAETAENVKVASINTGKTPEEILLKNRIVNEDQLYKAKADIYNVPFVVLAGKGISPEILNFVPEPVARKYTLIPFDLERKTNKLHVAMSDPLDLPLIEFLEQKSAKTIIPYLAKSEDILDKINEVYAQELTKEVTEALKESGETDESLGLPTIPEIASIIKEAPIAKIVSTILEFAIKSRASDVHLEPQEGRTRVRYRVDGILHEKLVLPRTVHDAVISRVKILSGMKIDEKRLPQDGRFSLKFGIDEVDLRVSTLPTVHGEKIVMRLLKKTGGVPDLPKLGLRGNALKSIDYAITRPHGIILVCGPTGSGKTTTLYSILSKLNTAKVNIMTLEDPVEYEIVGINQVQINPQAGLTFASGLRSFLRQDPNIILVGEIRDNETTTLAIQAALTGHLVFSTLHTNNAATAIPRLLDLGAEPFLIVSVLNAVEAQRIARRICPVCKESYQPLPAVIADIKQVLGNFFPKEKSQIQLYRGQGCKECNNTGYLGRIGIFETIIVNSSLARLILQRATATEIEKEAIAQGMITLKQDGYLKVLEGITSIEEVLRVAQE